MTPSATDLNAEVAHRDWARLHTLSIKIIVVRDVNPFCLGDSYRRCEANFNLHLLFWSIFLFCLTCIFRVIKSRRIRWAGNVARVEEGRGVYRVLVGKPEGKRPLGRPRRRWEDNIQMDLQEVGCGDMDWIELAQDRKSWRTLVNAVMDLRVP